MKKTLSHRDIIPNEYVYVTGKLKYSRITSKVEGEELATNNKWRIERGSMPINRPYTTATLSDAQIAISSTTPTVNERYIEESFYQSVSKPGSNMFTAYNKWNERPFVAQFNKETGKVEVIESVPGELAVGQEVTFVMRSYKGQMGNNGFILDGIIVNEDICYQEKDNKKSFNESKFNRYVQIIQSKA